MNTLSLAMRNLRRNQRRSLATLFAMAISLAAILLFGGYSMNIVLGLQTAYVQRVGHLQIQHKDYFLFGNGNPAAFGIVDYEKVIDLVKSDPVLKPMLNVVTPTLRLSGIAGNFSAGVSRTVIADGIIPAEQNKMFLWNEYGNTSYASPSALLNTHTDAAVIGYGVARVLQLCAPLNVNNCPTLLPTVSEQGTQMPKDITALSAMSKSEALPSGITRIEMLAATAQGAPNVSSLNVVKAENQGLKEMDDVYLTMHLPQAQRLVFGSAQPQVTAIQVQLHHTAQLTAAKERLAQLLATTLPQNHLAIRDYEMLAPIYGQSVDFLSSIFGFIASLIGIIVLFTISNTMSTSVVERTIEIGTLRAIGLRRAAIRRLFIWEGALLGILGAILGVVIAALAALLINYSGLTWIAPGYVLAYPLVVRVLEDPLLIIVCSFSMLLVAVLSAWWPADRASKINIVDALRDIG